MNLDYKKLLTPKELLAIMPMSVKQQRFVSQQRRAISDVLAGKNDRILLVVGPCSIHNIDSATEHANKLKSLSSDVSSRFLIVMRAYFEKPRTKTGWKGFLYDPKLDGSFDFELGFKLSRDFLLHLADLELPVATEFLDPIAANYFFDLVSLGTIGSRTVKSQIHRQLASSLPMPVGFKNPLSGNVQIAVDAAEVARLPHSFIGVNGDGHVSIVESCGNESSHVILRGSDSKINYDTKSVCEVIKKLEKTNVTKRILVDCAHGNRIFGQEKAFYAIMNQIDEGNKSIAGLFLESNLHEGKQPLNNKLKYGISITDHCIDFKTTKQLILSVYGDVR